MRSRIFLPLFLLMPLLWLFRRALVWGESFAFRDSAYYYFPYYQYVRDRWASGVPLWNPLDGLGQPLLADPTAAVFYPAKLLFLLPIDYTRCFAIYVVAHLLLCGIGTYRLSRALKATRQGSTLAAMAYPLSGQVLFQYCNPIYLVGAAWLPVALLCYCRVLQGRRVLPWVVGLSVVLSMMILGGDPQSAVHCVLCIFLACCLRGIQRLRSSRRFGVMSNGVVALTVACVLASLLSAVQILPSREWSARSDRSLGVHAPRSLTAVGVHYWKTDQLILDGLWKRSAEQSSHDKKIYHFSVGPWRWSELFWPSISGRFGPRHSRWLQGLPGEGRMWVASLYMGLLPVALALGRCRMWRTSATVQWISWFTVASLLAGMGEYGLGWILDEVRFQWDAGQPPATMKRGLGGVYWFLTVVVPTYSDFRYPAKWWTVTTLGVSLLAAKAWPLLWSKHRRYLLTWAAVGGCVSLIVACLARTVFTGQVPATAYGPFDERLSSLHFSQAIAHTTIVALVCVLLVARTKRSLGQWALLGICAAEIVVAQRWTVMTTELPIIPHPAQKNGQVLTTIWRDEGHLYPATFRSHASPDRMDESVLHDLRSLMPKYHLLTGQRQVNSVSSMRCGDLASVLELQDTLEVSGHEAERWAEFWGATPGSERAWLVYDWEQQTPPPETPLDDARRILLDRDTLRDFQQSAVVETSEQIPVPSRPGTSCRPCEVVERAAERLEVVAETDVPALLVMNDQYYPGWTATIEDDGGVAKAVPVVRVNRIMRGVFVPAGKSKITLTYRPESFRVGATVSVIAWGLVAVLLVVIRRIP